jgi:hypothetical protein
MGEQMAASRFSTAGEARSIKKYIMLKDRVKPSKPMSIRTKIFFARFSPFIKAF